MRNIYHKIYYVDVELEFYYEFNCVVLPSLFVSVIVGGD